MKLALLLLAACGGSSSSPPPASPVAAFRGPPESQVQLEDDARWTTIVDGLQPGGLAARDVEAAIKRAAGL